MVEIQKLFDDKSDIYAKARPRYPESLYKWLSEMCTQNHQVWDVGCGNGQASVDLSKYFRNVQATDVSASQIENAPNYPRVKFTIQPAENTNFNDAFFDAVCVAQALHWFDFELFWPEANRVLKSGGIFAAWGYVWPHIDSSIDSILDETFFSVIKPFWAEQNKILWDGYKTVTLPFEPIEVPNFVMNTYWSIEHLFAYLHSWSATRLCMKNLGEDFFHSSLQKVSKVWGGESIRSIHMDFVAIAGRKA